MLSGREPLITASSRPRAGRSLEHVPEAMAGSGRMKTWASLAGTSVPPLPHDEQAMRESGREQESGSE
jgi:hypothetical protein